MSDQILEEPVTEEVAAKRGNSSDQSHFKPFVKTAQAFFFDQLSECFQNAKPLLIRLGSLPEWFFAFFLLHRLEVLLVKRDDFTRLLETYFGVHTPFRADDKGFWLLYAYTFRFPSFYSRLEPRTKVLKGIEEKLGNHSTRGTSKWVDKDFIYFLELLLGESCRHYD